MIKMEMKWGEEDKSYPVWEFKLDRREMEQKGNYFLSFPLEDKNITSHWLGWNEEKHKDNGMLYTVSTMVALSHATSPHPSWSPLFMFSVINQIDPYRE